MASVQWMLVCVLSAAVASVIYAEPINKSRKLFVSNVISDDDKEMVLSNETTSVALSSQRRIIRNTNHSSFSPPMARAFTHCSRPCINSTCVMSNCMCFNNYKKSPNDPSICVPACLQPCRGGTCVAPEKCACLKGLVQKNKYECGPPHCRRPCINATCTDNDFCTCLPNYKKAVGDSFRCEPVCSPACGANATCHSPNHCECLGRFVRSPSGRCERPSPAGGCSSGFARVGGKCVPVCTGGCVNGVCTAPNRCLCNAGFIKDKMSSNYCVRNVG